MSTMQPRYGLQTKHKMGTGLDMSGLTTYRNCQTWLDL